MSQQENNPQTATCGDCNEMRPIASTITNNRTGEPIHLCSTCYDEYVACMEAYNTNRFCINDENYERPESDDEYERGQKEAELEREEDEKDRKKYNTGYPENWFEKSYP